MGFKCYRLSINWARIYPTGEEAEVQLEGVESVDLGDLGETPQEAPKEKGSSPTEDKKEEKKEGQQEGQ